MTDNEFDIVAQLLGKAGMGERLRVAYLLAMADLINAPGGYVKMQTEAADRTPNAMLLATSNPDLTRDPQKATRFKPTITRMFDPTGTYQDRFVWYV